MTHPLNELTFEVQEFPGPRWGVMAGNWNQTRSLGIDFHWTTKELAEKALQVYTVRPDMHGYSSELAVHRAWRYLNATGAFK